MENLINNLVLNATQHNICGGKILIRISNKSIVVSNTGSDQNIPEECLFKRFSRNTNDGVFKGHGLGLAINNKIAEIHKWKLKYDHRDNLHSFEIDFL